MSGLLGKIPKFTLKLPTALGKAGRTMSECPLELSFSLCEENSCVKQKFEKMPQENCEKGEIKMQMKECTPEKVKEENSEKEDNMEVTCSVSVDGQEKQEFSFTLYDLDTHDKINKQDVEKVVVRSICEALGKTLKLPPSGSRTIKVKLAISPDSNKNIDTKEQSGTKWPNDVSQSVPPPKIPDCNSAKSVNTSSTYLMSSVTDKPSVGHSQIYDTVISHSALPSNFSPILKPASSPKLHAARNARFTPSRKIELRTCNKDHERKIGNENATDNRHQCNENQISADEFGSQLNPLPTTSRDHVPECPDRRNHYLDLAGIENETKLINNPSSNSFGPSNSNLHYVCPYKILDRTHVCPKLHRGKDGSESSAKKPPLLCHSKVSPNNSDSSHAYRTKVNPDNKDDLLNLNFDLCDLVPEAKFDWEKMHHKRSKSYDLYDNELHNRINLYSPKLKQRPSQNVTSAVTENTKIPGYINSPVHHCRHRHRDRDRQRAMQQVANWIAREHSSNKEVNLSPRGFPKSSPSASAEKPEHYHLHEHIHHHYHHYIEF